MVISQNIASEIAYRLSETIGQNINFMDTTGKIIASSDPSRIGIHHGGAAKLIAEGLPQLIVTDDDQFPGSKSGVNLPIFFEDELIGTVGITGPVDEVLQYGQIIKKMTEILLLDNKTEERKIIEQKVRDRFFDEWVMGQLEIRNPREFKRMADSLEIDTSKPLRIVCLSYKDSIGISDTELSDISRKVRHATAPFGDAFRTATEIVCVIQESSFDDYLATILSVFKELHIQYGKKPFMGIANSPATLHLFSQYEKAEKALTMAIKRDDTYVFYNELDIDFMLDAIPERTCEEYIHRLFNQCSDEEIESFLSFAKIYLEENGSLKSISERMFVHINTIKYKIGKLTSATGIDIRTCKGAYVFTLACELYKNI